MGNIQSAVGSMVYGVQDVLSSTLSSARVHLDNIIGTVTTGLSHVYDGGFTGMSESGLEELKIYLNNYCNEVQQLIDGFDQTGDITSALKGEVQTAAYDYIAAIKKLLQAYVSTMRQEIAEIDEAYRNFVTANQSISQNVTSAAEEIRSQATGIQLD